MRFVCLALLLCAVGISAELDFIPIPRFRPVLNLHPVPSNIKITVKDLKETPEFQDIVKYISYHVSPSDIDEMLETIPEALNADVSAEEDTVAMPRSIGSVVGNVFDRIPWSKITNELKKMANGNSKFNKVLNLVNDQKFRDLVKKTVNSHTLAEFVKDVATHGFSWTEFLHLLLHGLCSAATTIQHDRYSVGVCQVLQNL